MASSKSEAQRLLDLIHKERVSESDKIPPGYHDAKEWQKMWGISRTSTRSAIDIALKKGIMDRKYFRVAINGNYHRVGYYRAIK
jgi:hypothetical protein